MKVVNLIKIVGFISIASFISAGPAFSQNNPDEGKILIIKKSQVKPEPTPPADEAIAPPQIIQSIPSETATANVPKTAPEGDKVVSEVAETAKPKKDEVVAPQSEEEKAILPIFQNYLAEYRLGPQDIISVEVFGQCPNYCIEGKTVPPNGKISYPLIREGVFVAGKTVEQVAEEITKKLDEYIIDPKVSVTLEKAMSARYSVLGKVASPGVRIMDRKVSVYEAIIESGGVLKDGDKKRVVVFSYNSRGLLEQKNINLLEVEKGKAPMVYLQSGDQVFVPDQGFKLSVSGVLKVLERLSPLRLLLGSPF